MKRRKKYLVARAAAFEGVVRYHQFQIDGNTIRVWDEIADHFTTCHSLSEEETARILALA